MATKFPKYQTVDDASVAGCYCCAAQLSTKTLRDSGYPSGSGQYAMRCRECTHYTYFDLVIEAKPVA